MDTGELVLASQSPLLLVEALSEGSDTCIFVLESRSFASLLSGI